MKSKYRICTDAFLGYEVQVKRWWWPFWYQIGGGNTNSSIEQAERRAKRHAKGRVVKVLGVL
jgi:hypothetical protein